MPYDPNSDQTAVQQFLTLVVSDSSLMDEVTKALDADDERTAVTALAKTKGYDFTPQELGAEMEKVEQIKREKAELSDAQLEAVAGGTVNPGGDMMWHSFENGIVPLIDRGIRSIKW